MFDEDEDSEEIEVTAFDLPDPKDDEDFRVPGSGDDEDDELDDE